jgi:hypothetical protein
MTTPSDVLTEEELAERAGATVDRVRELVDLGLLETEQGRFRRRDVLRLPVVGELTAMGIEAEGLAAALAAGELSLEHLESAGRRHPRSDRTFEQLGDEMGVGFRRSRRSSSRSVCRSRGATSGCVRRTSRRSRPSRCCWAPA